MGTNADAAEMREVARRTEVVELCILTSPRKFVGLR